MALTRLNIIAKKLHNDPVFGRVVKAWVRQRVTLFLAKGQQTYTIGPASTDSRASTAAGRTTISADEAAAQTVISITSNTDTTTYPGTTITMTNGDIVGIELNDGTIQWTTIAGTPASTMTIAVALTGAAAAGNYVYWFTSRAQRIQEVETAVLRNENYVDTPLQIYRELSEYSLGVSDKYADGDPTSILVEPTVLNTRIVCNFQPTDVTKQIVLVGFYPAEDYDATTDDIAFPQTCYQLLVSELMFSLAQSGGEKSWTPTMEQIRQEARASVSRLNPETTDVYFHRGGV